MEKVTDLRRSRALAFERAEALAHKPKLSAAETAEFDRLLADVDSLDGRLQRAQELQERSAATARPVLGQGDHRVSPAPESDPYVSQAAAEARGISSYKGLAIGGMCRILGQASRIFRAPEQLAAEQYGDGHPVTRGVRALVVSVGASGGFIVPPDYVAEIIELLRPLSVVRSSGPRVIPMPRGTMTLPSQATPATASYGSEVQQITASQQTLGQIIASYKKLTALVPVSNDMMRYADPAVDAFVRDDLVKVVALREDLAFLFGDGTAGTPRGYLSFANGWVLNQGGTAGAWSTTANSTAAANGTAGSALIGANGGNFITSNETYTLATAASELGGMVNKLDTANVPDSKRVWYMHPRTKNYLFNVQNSLGVYVYREEMSRGTLLTYPFKCSTQIGITYHDASSSNNDCSFIFLAEMDETMILDSMQLELAVTREGSYIDSTGATQSAFQNDQTLIRAIAEHDFQVRHDSSVAIAQFVRWAPAIS